MSNTLFEKLKKFVDLNREEKSRPGERNLTRYPIAAAVSDRLVRVIQPRKSTDAPQHHPDVSLRGAKRRGNLAGPGPITGQPRRIRRLLREIATSAYGLLAMTNLGALHGRRWCTEICGSAWRSRISMPLRERAEVRLARHEAGGIAVGAGRNGEQLRIFLAVILLSLIHI